MPSSNLSLTASAANLKRLAAIRSILLVALLFGLGYVRHATSSDLIHPAQLTILALFALLNILTYWRLMQPWPVTDLEYFGHLLFDIAFLSIVLYTNGGATNPFVSYYLVPITISAALLPWRYTLLVAGLSLTAYTLMLFYYLPFPALQPHQSAHAHDADGINLHIIGMWLTFALSTALITYFVVKMANALRHQEQRLARDREDELLEEQILAVATLAAGTAHELGTPLSTMMVLLDELIDTRGDDPEIVEDLQLLKAQAETCKQILKGLVNTAELRGHADKQSIGVNNYLRDVLDRWQLIRPNQPLEISATDTTRDRQLAVDPTLEQAICNLLNNAADAATDRIEVSLDCEGDTLILRIRDDGPGLPMEVAEHIGKPFVTTKGRGLGLGLFLSHATINRYGGSIALYDHPAGGTVAELRLPLTKEAERHD